MFVQLSASPRSLPFVQRVRVRKTVQRRIMNLKRRKQPIWHEGDFSFCSYNASAPKPHMDAAIVNGAAERTDGQAGISLASTESENLLEVF